MPERNEEPSSEMLDLLGSEEQVRAWTRFHLHLDHDARERAWDLTKGAIIARRALDKKRGSPDAP